MSLDIIQVSLGNVKVTPAIICSPSITFDIEFNDVLENILLLLKYITKSLNWQAFLGVFKYKMCIFHRCLICLIFTNNNEYYLLLLPFISKEIYDFPLLIFQILYTIHFSFLELEEEHKKGFLISSFVDLLKLL